MILLVDAGNTRIKWATWDGVKMTGRGHLFHVGIDRSRLGEKLWSDLDRPLWVVMASVAGRELEQGLSAWIKQTWHVAVELVRSQSSVFGVHNAYPAPEQMGVDRWVAMLGANARQLTPCCIIDCGTAITIDALAATGQHQGGVIFPGQYLMRQSLYGNTRQIPPAEQGQGTVFGKNTQDCVWGGTLYAAASAIDGICQRMEAKLAGKVQRVLTGGDAEGLLPYLRGPYRLEKDLLFYGLLVAAGEYQSPSLSQ
jgi:type III pantothenate kinase